LILAAVFLTVTNLFARTWRLSTAGRDGEPRKILDFFSR